MTEYGGPTYLYRLWDDAGALLYVGISKSAAHRLAEHHAEQPWGSEAVTMTATRLPTRTAAERAEREAIVTERPRHNVTHAVREPERRPWRRGLDYVRAECFVCGAESPRYGTPALSLALPERELEDAWRVGRDAAAACAGWSSYSPFPEARERHYLCSPACVEELGKRREWIAAHPFAS